MVRLFSSFNLKNKFHIILFFAIIIAQLIVITHYCFTKGGMYIDEQWSYNLANSYNAPFLWDNSSLFNKIIERDFFVNALSVQENERFTYSSVIKSQSMDVHPPLFYIVLHTVCSFFLNNYSLWLGIIPNLFYFVITQYFIYKIMMNICDNRTISIVAVFIYGFSLGCVSTNAIVRMYSMLTMFTVIATFINLDFIKLIVVQQQKISLKHYILLGTVYFLGFMTHYFFLLIGFFLSTFVLSILIIFNNLKNSIIYSISALSGIIFGVIAFPAAITHTLYSYRGIEALDNIEKSDISSRLDVFYIFAKNEISLGYFTFVLSFIILFLVLSYFITISKSDRNVCIIFDTPKLVKGFTQKNIEIKISVHLLCLLTLILATTAVFVLVSKIAAFNDQRYIFNIYPLIVICVISIIFYVFKVRQWNPKICYTVLVLIGCLGMNNLSRNNIYWNYSNEMPAIEKQLPKGKSISILIQNNTGWHPAVAFLKYFVRTDISYFTNENNFVNFQIPNVETIILIHVNPGKNFESTVFIDRN